MTAEQTRPQRRSASKWLPLVLLLLALAVYLPTVGQGRVVTDNQAAAASAWRIATTGRPWMEGVPTRDLAGSPYSEMWLVETPDDHQVHNRTPGVILPAVPFYWVLNNDSAASGFRIWVGGVAAASVTAGAGLLMFYGLRSTFDNRTAFAGTCLLLFTTPVWSVSANALWTHNTTILAVSGAVWAASRSRWWLTGAFFALGIFARAHLALIAAVVGVYLGWRRRDWRIVVQTGLSSSLGLLMLGVWNRMVFGSWSLRGGYETYVTENLIAGNATLLYEFANVVGFMMSPDRGILVWTPVILFLLPSMLASWGQLPDWVRALVLGGAVYSVVQLQINSFQGGQGFYGYRLALELLVCMVPALIYAYKATATLTRLVIGGLFGVQFAAIGVGATADSYYVSGGDMWTTNAYLVALGDHPLALGILTAASSLMGVLLTGFLLGRSQDRGGVGEQRPGLLT